MNKASLYSFSKEYYQYDISSPSKASLTALKIVSIFTLIIPILVKIIEHYRLKDEKIAADRFKAATTLQQAFRKHSSLKGLNKFQLAVKEAVRLNKAQTVKKQEELNKQKKEIDLKKELGNKIIAALIAKTPRAAFKNEHDKLKKFQETITNSCSGLLAAKDARRDYRYNKLIYGPRIEAEKRKKFEAATLIQSTFRRFEAKKLLSELKRNNSTPEKKIDTTLIEDGYGQFIVSKTNGANLTKEEHEKIYPILLKYDHKAPINGKTRFQAISEEIKGIDPDFNLTFLPRTLYDLFFIRTVIHEEIKDKRACHFQASHFDDYIKYEGVEVKNSLDHCWHIAATKNRALSSDHEFVKTLSFRMNNLIIERLKPSGPLSVNQINILTEVEVANLIRHGTIFAKLIFNSNYSAPCGVQGVSINFGLDKSCGSRIICKPLKIESSRQVSLIFNAIALECSQKAKNAVLLYRGGKPKKTIDLSIESRCYGSSLYSGALFDADCSPASDAKGKKGVYALAVPFNSINDDSVFDISIDHPIAQLSGRGLFFQPRTRVTEVTVKRLPKTYMDFSKVPDRVKSNRPKAELAKELERYYDNVIILSQPAVRR